MLVSAVLAGLCASAWADGKRLGFVNLSRAPDAPATVTSLRQQVSPQGYELVESEGLRKALEAPLPASAESALVSQARSLIGSAKDAYANFSYELAIARLQAVDALLMSSSPSPEVVAALVERYLLTGLVYAGMGDAPAVERAFRLVQHLQPGQGSLDPGLYRPSIVDTYRQVHGSPQPGVPLTVVSEPMGAAVWLDGRALGPAPQTVEAPSAGLHHVVVEMPGYRPQGVIFEVATRAPGATAGRRLFTLAPRPQSQRVIELRRQALASPATVDWQVLGNHLSGLVQVDMLVMVRDGDGGLQASVYREGRLGPWMKAAPARVAASLQPVLLDARETLLALDADQGAMPMPGLATRVRLQGVAGRDARTRDGAGKPRRWYRTWWGALAIGGALATAGVITYAVIDARGHRYQLGEVCFSESCP